MLGSVFRAHSSQIFVLYECIRRHMGLNFDFTVLVIVCVFYRIDNDNDMGIAHALVIARCGLQSYRDSSNL